MKFETVGEKIRHRREELNYSLNHLAKLAGISYATLMHIEKGETLRPRNSVLRRISKALEYNAEALLQYVPLQYVPQKEKKAAAPPKARKKKEKLASESPVQPNYDPTKKYCPFLGGGTLLQDPVPCMKDKCGLWVKDGDWEGCAIACIACDLAHFSLGRV